MAVITRGHTTTSYGGPGWDATATLGVHADTVPGDWAIVVGHASDYFTVTEAGFQQAAILEVTAQPEPDRGYGEVWVGLVPADETIEFYFRTGSGGIAGGGATITVVTMANRPNPSRVATVATHNSDSFALPGIAGRGDGVVALGIATHGIGSTTWDGSASFASPATQGAYYVTAYDVADAESFSGEASSWTYASGATSSAFAVVGVGGFGDAPPCRLFPREDGLGVGGGRIFPPPKSQQRSGRRFGYY